MGFDKASYDKKFMRENYDDIKIRVPKGKRVIIKACAEEKGISINQLVIDALEYAYNLNLSKT